MFPEQPIGIQSLEMGSVQRPAVGMEVPPGDAVHDEEHQAVLVEQGRDVLGDGRQGRGLDRDDDDVLRFQVLDFVGGERT